MSGALSNAYGKRHAQTTYQVSSGTAPVLRTARVQSGAVRRLSAGWRGAIPGFFLGIAGLVMLTAGPSRKPPCSRSASSVRSEFRWRRSSCWSWGTPPAVACCHPNFCPVGDAARLGHARRRRRPRGGRHRLLRPRRTDQRHCGVVGMDRPLCGGAVPADRIAASTRSCIARSCDRRLQQAPDHVRLDAHCVQPAHESLLALVEVAGRQRAFTAHAAWLSGLRRTLLLIRGSGRGGYAQALQGSASLMTPASEHRQIAARPVPVLSHECEIPLLQLCHTVWPCLV